MKIVKGLLVAVLALAMTACASTPKQETPKKEEPVKMMVPMGATALSMLGIYGDSHVTIDTVNGSDALAAQFNKKDGYDVIIAPINLGAKLIASGKSDYMLDSVVTWGNLYIVGTDESALQSDGIFAAFGEAAVPQKVLMSSMDMKLVKPTLTYFNSVNDVQAQLLTQKAKVGMLAEPAATATIAKAKEKGLDLKVLRDLQKEYKKKNHTSKEGYPQAALFVKKGSEKKVAPYLEKAKTFANKTAVNDDAAIAKAVAKATPEKLGVPNAQIVQKTWKRLHINFVKANHVATDIKTFLDQFHISLSSAHYTK